MRNRLAQILMKMLMRQVTAFICNDVYCFIISVHCTAWTTHLVCISKHRKRNMHISNQLGCWVSVQNRVPHTTAWIIKTEYSPCFGHKLYAPSPYFPASTNHLSVGSVSYGAPMISPMASASCAPAWSPKPLPATCGLMMH